MAAVRVAKEARAYKDAQRQGGCTIGNLIYKGSQLYQILLQLLENSTPLMFKGFDSI